MHDLAQQTDEALGANQILGFFKRICAVSSQE